MTRSQSEAPQATGLSNSSAKRQAHNRQAQPQRPNFDTKLTAGNAGGFCTRTTLGEGSTKDPTVEGMEKSSTHDSDIVMKSSLMGA